MKLNRLIITIIVLIAYVNIVNGSHFTDMIYCKIKGDCELNTLTVGNLTVTDNYMNVTVTSYNVTGDIELSGDLNISGCVNFPDGTTMCTNNVTDYYPLDGANSLCLSGSCISSWDNVNQTSSGTGSGKKGFPPYLYNDSDTMYFNTTQLSLNLSPYLKIIDYNVTEYLPLNGGTIANDLEVDGTIYASSFLPFPGDSEINMNTDVFIDDLGIFNDFAVLGTSLLQELNATEFCLGGKCASSLDNINYTFTDTNLSAGGRIDGDLFINGKLNVSGCATYTTTDGYVTLCGDLSTYYNTTGGYVCTGHCI